MININVRRDVPSDFPAIPMYSTIYYYMRSTKLRAVADTTNACYRLAWAWYECMGAFYTSNYPRQIALSACMSMSNTMSYSHMKCYFIIYHCYDKCITRLCMHACVCALASTWQRRIVAQRSVLSFPISTDDFAVYSTNSHEKDRIIIDAALPIILCERTHAHREWKADNSQHSPVAVIDDV